MIAPPQLRRPHVLFLNRSYWPDAEATGQLLTELCEDLAALPVADPTGEGGSQAAFDITVICGHPNVSETGAEHLRSGTEARNGVTLRRVWHTRFSKGFLPGRLINYLSFLCGAWWAALWVRKPDLVVVETDPPLLCLIGWYLQLVRGAKLVVYLQDIHPDIAVALGKIPDGRLTRLLRALMFGIYRGADRVVTLSRDMCERVVASGVDPQRVICIPNWIDTARVHPIKHNNPFREQHGLNGQFLVMYSGNLGLSQRLEDVIAAAGYLRDRDDILFLLIGAGVLKKKLEQQVAEQGLPNVRFLPYRAKSELAQSLSAADLHLVPLDPRVASCLMPSKLYGVLASGTPLVAVAPDECELAELTREHDIGVVAPPGEPEALADIIRHLADEMWDLDEMGLRARQLAERLYDRSAVTARFGDLLAEVLDLELRPSRSAAGVSGQGSDKPQVFSALPLARDNLPRCTRTSGAGLADGDRLTTDARMLFSVITTIQPPTPCMVRLAARLQELGAPLVVVGDQRGPDRYDLPGARLLTLADQLQLPYRLAKLLPTGHYARKNLGYLTAIAAGAESIYETDDDNAPTEEWLPRSQEVEARELSGTRWLNVYRAFTDEPIWPRGLPLDRIRTSDPADHGLGSGVRRFAPIQQGLVDGSPDVDAIWRLVMDRPFTFRRAASVSLAPGTWCPFNTQSTWWWPAAYALMYLPSHCTFRMTDIWRGLVAQRCLWAFDAQLVFHAAEVEQERNQHNLLRDFEHEVPGYLQNDAIVLTLDALDLEPGLDAVGRNLRCCYRALIQAAFLPPDELPLVDAWLEDVSGARYHYHTSQVPGIRCQEDALSLTPAP